MRSAERCLNSIEVRSPRVYVAYVTINKCFRHLSAWRTSVQDTTRISARDHTSHTVVSSPFGITNV